MSINLIAEVKGVPGSQYPLYQTPTKVTEEILAGTPDNSTIVERYARWLEEQPFNKRTVQRHLAGLRVVQDKICFYAL